MKDELLRLIDEARTYRMTPEEVQEQRISFVYGNLLLDGSQITRDQVADAASRSPLPQSRGREERS